MREMKDSGVEWIGEIPADWTIVRVSHLFANRKNPNRKGEQKNRLSLSYGRIIRKDINSEEGLLPESFNTYNIVEPGDIIIRPTDLQNDKRSLRTGLSKDHGIITSAYIALKPITSRIDSRFYYYLLHSYDIEKVFYNMGNGVRQGLTFALFAKLPIVKPSLLEQQSIADYLDSKCSQIDFIVEKTRQEIEKLKEYRQSMITEAVTKGLDPDVEMKDSGVEWIGEIPKGWNVVPTKRLMTIGSGGTPSDNILNWDGNIPWVTPADFDTSQHYLWSGRRCLSQSGYESCAATIVPGGSLIFSKRAPIGKVVICKQPVSANQGCLTCVPITSCNTNFLYYFMAAATEEYELRGSGTTFKEISSSEFGQTLMLVPPVYEQDHIANYLDSKCSYIASAISTKQNIIDKLQQYKKSLIYECVTGKKEVPYNA